MKKLKKPLVKKKVPPKKNSGKKRSPHKSAKEDFKDLIPAGTLIPVKNQPHKYSLAALGGSPRMYATDKEMEPEIDGYFEYIKGEYEERKVVTTVKGKRVEYVERICIREPEPATITGLALYLGFSNKESIRDYEKKGAEFMALLKRARARVEYNYEKRLHGDKPVGAIFALKNMGWKDRTVITDDDDNPILGFNYLTPQQPKQ